LPRLSHRFIPSNGVRMSVAVISLSSLACLHVADVPAI
jgi:hypothetical protein